jgi:hypothetical protein
MYAPRQPTMSTADERERSMPDDGRRDFLRWTAAAGVGATLGRFGFGMPPAGEMTRASTVIAPGRPFAAPPMERVRVGFVGVGGQGTVHVENLLACTGVEIKAICDIVPAHAERAAALTVKAGQPAPTLYTRGPRDFERMCAEETLDLVFTATPWEWHVPVCVAAMKNGKHAATEVPAAYTLEGCWELVETAEKLQKHCVMMENCNYGRTELMVLNMVRQGVLGEILHGEGGYLHDLRSVKFDTDGEGLWRRAHATKRSGNFYPTHGLGPVANCLDINRGDRFDYIVSMSGPSRGLQGWQRDHLAADDPRRQETYVLGDVNVSLIKTMNGKTIFVSHDTNLPRPYSRINNVQGTKGLVSGYPDRVYVEGRSQPHRWEEAKAYQAEFDHPLWRSERVQQVANGHGGMDFLEDYRLIACLRAGLPTDTNVYDAAALSAVCATSERSVMNRSRPIDIPDFTRGRWKTAAAWPIVEA